MALETSRRSSISPTCAPRRSFTAWSSACSDRSRSIRAIEARVSMSVTAMSVIRESIVLKLRASLPSSSSVCYPGADEEFAELGPSHHPRERLDGLEQEMTRRESDGHPCERERQQGAEDGAGAQLVERHRRVTQGDAVAVRDESAEHGEQQQRRGDGPGEDELEGERSADTREHEQPIVPPLCRTGCGWVRNAHYGPRRRPQCAVRKSCRRTPQPCR